MKLPYNFYFVRHGQTPWGIEDILKGPQDLGLNDLGMQQAKSAGFILKNLLDDVPKVKIVSSPLLRAIQTAKEIEKVTGFPIVAQEDGLQERYYGDFRKISDKSQIPPDAEATEEFQTRVLESLMRLLLEYHDARHLIIVSHQKVFEYIAGFLTNRQEKLQQGGISHFMLRENGAWELIFPTPKAPLLSSHASFFRLLEKSFLTEYRHHDNKIQHEYDKRYGLVLRGSPIYPLISTDHTPPLSLK